MRYKATVSPTDRELTLYRGELEDIAKAMLNPSSIPEMLDEAIDILKSMGWVTSPSWENTESIYCMDICTRY